MAATSWLMSRLGWGTSQDAPQDLPAGRGALAPELLRVLEFRNGKNPRENVWMDLAWIMRQLAKPGQRRSDVLSLSISLPRPIR
jgi:hypothetical protein